MLLGIEMICRKGILVCWRIVGRFYGAWPVGSRIGGTVHLGPIPFWILISGEKEEKELWSYSSKTKTFGLQLKFAPLLSRSSFAACTLSRMMIEAAGSRSCITSPTLHGKRIRSGRGIDWPYSFDQEWKTLPWLLVGMVRKWPMMGSAGGPGGRDGCLAVLRNSTRRLVTMIAKTRGTVKVVIQGPHLDRAGFYSYRVGCCTNSSLFFNFSFMV